MEKSREEAAWEGRHYNPRRNGKIEVALANITENSLLSHSGDVRANLVSDGGKTAKKTARKREEEKLRSRGKLGEENEEGEMK